MKNIKNVDGYKRGYTKNFEINFWKVSKHMSDIFEKYFGKLNFN